MDDILLDTSWTLFCPSTYSPAYHNLFAPSTTEAHLARYFDSLSQLYSSQHRSEALVDDLDNEHEKLGSLRECRYSFSTLGPARKPQDRHLHEIEQTSMRLIQIKLRYPNATFTFVLYTAYLILIKAPVSHTRTFTDHLVSTFNIESIDPLKLSSEFLGATLENYVFALIETFVADRDDDDSLDDNARNLNVEKRAAILRSAVGTLKLTISFSGTVAPHLKTLELSVPYETLQTLSSVRSTPQFTASAATRRKHLNGPASRLPSPAAEVKSDGVSDPDSSSFLTRLAHHIHLQTGLRLPLGISTDPDENNIEDTSTDMISHDFVGTRQRSPANVTSVLPREDDATSPLRLSKVTTAAFVIGIEGRLRMAGRAIDHAGSNEDLIVAANITLLDDVVRQAKRRVKQREHTRLT